RRALAARAPTRPSSFSARYAELPLVELPDATCILLPVRVAAHDQNVAARQQRRRGEAIRLGEIAGNLTKRAGCVIEELSGPRAGGDEYVAAGKQHGCAGDLVSPARHRRTLLERRRSWAVDLRCTVVKAI